MKKSLELLFNTSGEIIEAISNDDIHNISDTDCLSTAKRIKSPKDKIAYLKSIISDLSKVVSFPSSTNLLIELIKKDEKYYATDLAIALYRSTIDTPISFVTLAEVAIADNAWAYAQEALKIAELFACGSHSRDLKDVINLKKQVIKKLTTNADDNSSSAFWKSKAINYMEILTSLSNGLTGDMLFKYCCRLLSLFHNNEDNYIRVFIILRSLDDLKIIKMYCDFVKDDKNLDDKNKTFILGLILYELAEPYKSIEYLEKYIAEETNNLDSKVFLSFNYLVLNEVEKFKSILLNTLPGHKSVEEVICEVINQNKHIYSATLFILAAYMNINIKDLQCSRDKAISKEITMILGKLLRSDVNKTFIDTLISRFQDLNYYAILPSLNLYLAEYFINKEMFETARIVLKDCVDNEKHRLLAWILRLEGKEDEAEKELADYRSKKAFGVYKLMKYKLLSLNIPEELPDDSDKILNILQNAYVQTEKLKHQIATEYGLNRDTCFELGCIECCVKTFPMVSYTEYLQIRKWLDSQKEEVKNTIYNNSFKIVEAYKEKYKRDPPFLWADDTDAVDKYYPDDFSFDCPALSLNLCSVYEVQPFICRAYGYSSHNKVQIKGCGYYARQLSVATDISRVRKVIDEEAFIEFRKKADYKLIQTSVVAPMPIWFAQGHELTRWKAKAHMVSRGFFAPFYRFMTGLYVKKLKSKNKEKSEDIA